VRKAGDWISRKEKMKGRAWHAEIRIAKAIIYMRIRRMRKMVILKAHECDLAGVRELMKDMPRMGIPSLKDFKKNYRKGKCPKIIMAFYEGEIAGTAAYSISYDVEGNGEVFLYALAVKKELRRKKIGTKLVRHVMKEAEKINCKAVALTVHKENKEALEFYKKLKCMEENGEYKLIFMPVG